MSSLNGFYKKHNRTIWAIIIAIPFLIVAIAYAVAPETVWNEFIWRYYVAPIEADARGEAIDGITESYNPVDSLTYALVLFLVVIGVYELLKKLDIEPGKGMFFGAIPYILLGGILRSFEDAGLFTGKAVYLFIAPIIYIFIGIVTIIKLVESKRISELDKKGPEGRKKALLLFIGIHVVWNVLFAIAYMFFINERELFTADTQNVAYMVNPMVSVLLSACAFLGLCILMRRSGRIESHDVFAVFGWHFFAIAVFQAASFMMLDGRWPGTDIVSERGLVLYELLIVPAIALVVTAIFVGISHGLTGRWSWLGIYWKNRMNIAIIYAHMFDAAATFTAIQFYDYGEKHVLPSSLINATGLPAVMFPLKMIGIGLVLYILEVYLKKDLKRYPLFNTLIWIAILVLGLAPGTRDLMRLAMGV